MQSCKRSIRGEWEVLMLLLSTISKEVEYFIILVVIWLWFNYVVAKALKE